MPFDKIITDTKSNELLPFNKIWTDNLDQLVQLKMVIKFNNLPERTFHTII